MGEVSFKRLAQGIGLIGAIVVPIWGVGGPVDAIGAVRESLDFLLLGTGYGAAAWIAPETLATPLRIALGAYALCVVGWVFWPIKSERIRIAPSIPIAFNEIRSRSFVNYAYTGGPDASHQPQLFDYGIVTIANISPTQSVSLELHLRLTAPGWDMKLPASPLDSLGRDFRSQGIRPKIIEEHGIIEPPCLQNPILIKPGDAVTGSLAFLFTPFDQAMRDNVVGAIISPGLTHHLVISDVFSGVELQMKLPVAYRG